MPIEFLFDQTMYKVIGTGPNRRVEFETFEDRQNAQTEAAKICAAMQSVNSDLTITVEPVKVEREATLTLTCFPDYFSEIFTWSKNRRELHASYADCEGFFSDYYYSPNEGHVSIHLERAHNAGLGHFNNSRDLPEYWVSPNLDVLPKENRMKYVLANFEYQRKLWNQDILPYFYSLEIKIEGETVYEDSLGGVFAEDTGEILDTVLDYASIPAMFDITRDDLDEAMEFEYSY